MNPIEANKAGDNIIAFQLCACLKNRKTLCCCKNWKAINPPVKAERVEDSYDKVQ